MGATSKRKAVKREGLTELFNRFEAAGQAADDAWAAAFTARGPVAAAEQRDAERWVLRERLVNALIAADGRSRA